MKFYLGTHMANWLGDERFSDVPLFVSTRRLRNRATFPRAVGSWALDSGGFTELSMYGEWRTSASQYAAEVNRYAREIGGLEWVAPRDWMCEPFMLAKTGRTIADHQERTVDSYLDLVGRGLAARVVPVLQGWERDDYLRHIDSYAARGVDLEQCATVGVGSVCRRQDLGVAEYVIMSIASTIGARSHGFGIKTGGVHRYGAALGSADSLAWSFNARKHPPIDGHTHKSCANCPVWALRWRRRVLEPSRPTLFSATVR